MSASDKSLWIASATAALVLHAAAILVFAGLLQARQVNPAPSVRLGDGGLVQSPVIAEVATAEDVVPDAQVASLGETTAAVAITESSGVETVQQKPDESVDVLSQGYSAEQVDQTPDAGAIAQQDNATIVQMDSATDTAAGSETESDIIVSLETNSTPVETASDPAGLPETASAAASSEAGTSAFVDVAETAAPLTPQIVEQTQVEELGFVQESNQVALLQPKPPTPRSSPAPPKPAPVDVAGVARSYSGGNCFLAIPKRDDGDRWAVTVYGSQQTAFDKFGAYLSAEGAADIAQSQRAIQELQCAALDFATAYGAHKTARFTVRLGSDELADADTLRATLSGFRNTWIYIFLVDDDGVAHDVSRYAEVAGTDVTVAMPVHVRGDGRDRYQLLFAVSSSAALSMLDLDAPKPLAQVLPLVRGQIAASQADVEIAVTSFRVK